jgi:hypothetical protein
MLCVRHAVIPTTVLQLLSRGAAVNRPRHGFDFLASITDFLASITPVGKEN